MSAVEDYGLTAREAAQAAIAKVPYPAGGLIENEIHTYLEESAGMDPLSDEIFDTGNAALEVAGIMLGVGPDAL